MRVCRPVRGYPLERDDIKIGDTVERLVIELGWADWTVDAADYLAAVVLEYGISVDIRGHRREADLADFICRLVDSRASGIARIA